MHRCKLCGLFIGYFVYGGIFLPNTWKRADTNGNFGGNTTADTSKFNEYISPITGFFAICSYYIRMKNIRSAVVVLIPAKPKKKLVSENVIVPNIKSS